LAWLLVPHLGTAGAAIAASLSYGAAVAVLAGLFVRHAELRPAQLWPGPVLVRDLLKVASHMSIRKRS